MIDEHQHIWVFGVNSVAALLQKHSRYVHQICYSETCDNPRIKLLCTQAQALGITMCKKTIGDIEKITNNSKHQNIIALCSMPEYLTETDLELLCKESSASVFLILDCMTNVGNFGACLRTAAACHVTAVIIPANRSVGMTPAVIKAASGTAYQVAVVRVPNLVRAINKIKEQGVWVVGSDSQGSDNYCSVDYRRPTAFVLGSESEGLRRLVAEQCDYKVNIPMSDTVESLNVSVATGVLLYELRRQRMKV